MLIVFDSAAAHTPVGKWRRFGMLLVRPDNFVRRLHADLLIAAAVALAAAAASMLLRSVR